MTSPRISHLSPGEDLLAALTAQPSGAWVQAVGYVDAVELRLPFDATDVTCPLRGRLALVSLAGTPGGPFSVTLARATDAGAELLGGHLVRARSAGVTLSVFEPATAPSSTRRSPRPRGEAAEAAPATPSSTEEPGEDAPSPEQPATSNEGIALGAAPSNKGWDEVVAASEQSSDEDDDEQSPDPDIGDLVEHFAFGLVEVVDTDGEKLRLRDPKSGRVREVALTALRVQAPTEHEGKRLFKLLRKG